MFNHHCTGQNTQEMDRKPRSGVQKDISGCALPIRLEKPGHLIVNCSGGWERKQASQFYSGEKTEGGTLPFQ